MAEKNKLRRRGAHLSSARARLASCVPPTRFPPSFTATAPKAAPRPRCPATKPRFCCARSNVIVTLDIEGDKQLALVKDVQKDPVRQLIEHIDMIVVRKGEKVDGRRVRAPRGRVGPRHDRHGRPQHAHRRGRGHAHSRVVHGVDRGPRTSGSQIHASDVELPDGTTLITDPEALVRQHHHSAARRPAEDDEETGGDDEAEGAAGGVLRSRATTSRTE